MDAKIFTEVPNELKTIEVDVERKIFNINGKPFGEECTGFRISCTGGGEFSVLVEIDTTIRYANYDNHGDKKAGYTYEKHSQ